jgi:hypothetical protein
MPFFAFALRLQVPAYPRPDRRSCRCRLAVSNVKARLHGENERNHRSLPNMKRRKCAYLVHNRQTRSHRPQSFGYLFLFLLSAVLVLSCCLFPLSEHTSRAGLLFSSPGWISMSKTRCSLGLPYSRSAGDERRHSGNVVVVVVVCEKSPTIQRVNCLQRSKKQQNRPCNNLQALPSRALTSAQLGAIARGKLHLSIP